MVHTPLVSPLNKSWVGLKISSTISIHLIIIFLSNLSTCFSSSHARSSPVTPSPKLLYSDYCNSFAPESIPIHYLNHFVSNNLGFSNGYYIGGDRFLNPQISKNFTKFVDFYVIYQQKTHTKDVIILRGILTFRSPNRYRKVRVGHAHFQVQDDLSFKLQGFWSESSGKLCMVGFGNGYSRKGKRIHLLAVFKLNYPKKSNIFTSFITGTLESVNKTDSLNYFEPISLLAYSQLNYEYTLVWNIKAGFPSGEDENKGLTVNWPVGDVVDQDICFVLGRYTFVFELEYGSGCGKNCSPIVAEKDFLPEFMSFSGIKCSEKHRSRMLLGFYNSSFTEYHQPLVPGRMLVGEGIWDEESNRLYLVVCPILNVTDSSLDASIGDCSIRLSLWFPAVLTIKTRSAVLGEIWIDRGKGDSDYFDRIRFRSFHTRRKEVPGLKYEYTEVDRARKSCATKMIGGDKGEKYPGAYSNNLMFDMRVGNDRRAWGFGRPATVGDLFYEKYNGPRQSISWESADSQSTLVNISYKIHFTPPTLCKLAGQLSSTSMTRRWSDPIEIAAEGIYNTGTGDLCMVGCRYLGSNYRKSVRNNSMDCEILINAHFTEVNAKSKNRVNGSIESTRERSDPLYFDLLEFVSVSLSANDALEAVWRLDLEITMVLIAKTLICAFVGSQLFYVKNHPNVLPSISIMMLVILTFGHMIPLVLNFESLLLTNGTQQNTFGGTGGLLEVNEVIVRVITMIAFLLQFYLLQLTLSSRLSGGDQQDLWHAEKKALYVFLPLCLVIGFIAWLIHCYYGFEGHSIVEDLRSYAGLVQDGFLLPQILLNLFWNSKTKALSPPFYFGTTAARMVPHAYDLYRAHRFVAYSNGRESFYANPSSDIFSSSGDIIIPCGVLVFAIIVYFQQLFGGACILPPRFRAFVEYEKVPAASTDGD